MNRTWRKPGSGWPPPIAVIARAVLGARTRPCLMGLCSPGQPRPGASSLGLAAATCTYHTAPCQAGRGSTAQHSTGHARPGRGPMRAQQLSATRPLPLSIHLGAVNVAPGGTQDAVDNLAGLQRCLAHTVPRTCNRRTLMQCSSASIAAAAGCSPVHCCFARLLYWLGQARAAASRCATQIC